MSHRAGESSVAKAMVDGQGAEKRKGIVNRMLLTADLVKDHGNSPGVITGIPHVGGGL
jgi:hypothetical protein